MSDTSEKNKSELDEYGVWVKSPQAQIEKDSEAAPAEDFNTDFPDINFDDISGTDSTADESTADKTLDEDISLDEFITDGFSEPEDTKTEPAAEQPQAEESEVSLDDFISPDEFGFSEDAPAEQPAPSSDGEVSLDEFMDGDFSMPPQPEDSAPEETEEEDPLDIDLDFDESAQELQGEEQESTDGDLDSLISEISDDVEDVENIIPDSGSDGSEDIDLSAFGFEDDSDNQNPVIDTGEPKKPEGPVDYEMNVDIDEDTPEEKIQEQSADSEDISIDISTDEPVGTESVVDQDKDFNAPDDDFDADSILNSIEDESGNSFSFDEINTSEQTTETVETDAFQEQQEADDSDATFSEQISEETQEPVFQEEPQVDVDGFDASTFETIDPFATDGTDDISLNEFMGEEGFTDGGPRVTGEFSQESTQEPEITEIDLTQNSGDEPQLTTQEETDFTQNTSDEMIADIMNQNITRRDTSEILVETASEKNDDESIEGVSLTMDDFEKLDSQPVVDTEEIPDSFDEEAASLNSDEDSEEVSFPKQTYSVFETKPTAEDTEPVKTQTSNSVSENDILLQISGELASLRNEITSLKTQFAELKNGEISHADIHDELDLPTPKSGDDSEGFFSETDTDDTIALSGDELNNILNTAEFTQDEHELYVESTENDLSMDFNNEQLEEPVFEDQDFDASEEETETEENDEISVPKVDDILVESSQDDLIENGINTESIQDQNDVTLDDEAVPDTTLESLSQPIDLFNEDEAEDETIEEGISESPVQEVFNSWDAKSDEEPEIADASEQLDIPFEPDEPSEENAVADTDITVEPALEETDTFETQEITGSRADEIPNDMKQEIKSVLSYMDQLLENLPEDKIAEFAQSEQFETYKKLFNELGLA